MMHAMRPLPFVLASSNHGMVIVNRNDYHQQADGQAYGVGHQLLNHASLVIDEITVMADMLAAHRAHFGDGAVAIDCGANIGIYTLDLARVLNGWGHVYAFEAQEKLFYALAGNVIMNNYLNVTARFCAVGAEMGSIEIPEPDYCRPASFASFELKKMAQNQNIGQAIDYSNATQKVPLITLDSLELPRVDLIKIDVEGMEDEVLKGAEETIQRCKPILFVEVIKSNQEHLLAWFKARNYRVIPAGMNVYALHESDPIIASLDAMAAAQQGAA